MRKWMLGLLGLVIALLGVGAFFSLQMISIKLCMLLLNFSSYLLILNKECGLVYLLEILKVSEKSRLLLWF